MSEESFEIPCAARHTYKTYTINARAVAAAYCVPQNFLCLLHMRVGSHDQTGYLLTVKCMHQQYCYKTTGRM
jgi:hypothetical protein